MKEFLKRLLTGLRVSGTTRNAVSEPTAEGSDVTTSAEFKALCQQVGAELTVQDMLRFRAKYEDYTPGAATFDRSKLSLDELARFHVFLKIAQEHYEGLWPNRLGYFGEDSPVVDNGFFYTCRYCNKRLILPEMRIYDAEDGDYIFCSFSCQEKGRYSG